MNNKKEIPVTLSAKYLSGMATPDEILELHEYLKDPELSLEFDRLSKLWRYSSMKNDYKSPSVDNAWKEFQLLKEERKSERVRNISIPRYAVAAAIAGLIGLATWLYLRTPTSPEQMMSHQISNNISTDTLSDGSIAVLNVNSKLSYSPTFKNKLRSVVFNGEAFFNVIPNKNKPFEITIHDVKVKVIGTSFNVREIKNDRLVVQVATGIVEIYTDHNSIVVRERQTGIYNFSTKEFLIQNAIDINSFAYATNDFAFSDIPFRTACDYLEKAFNVNISLEAGVFDDCQISSEFQNKSLQYILEVLSNTLNASYTREKNMIYIKGKVKGKACE